MDVTIVGEELHNLVFWSALYAFKHGDIFIVSNQPCRGTLEIRPV